jgi:hypothetical protein
MDSRKTRELRAQSISLLGDPLRLENGNSRQSHSSGGALKNALTLAAVALFLVAQPCPLVQFASAQTPAKAKAALSGSFSKAAIKVLVIIDNYNGQEDSRHRMDSALEDAEVEAQTDAENAQMTALKNMALNDQAAIDLDLQVQAEIDDTAAKVRAAGATAPATKMPSMWEARRGHDCVTAWKATLRALKTSIPEVCMLAIKAPPPKPS